MKVPTHRRLVGANPIATAMTPMIDVVFLLLVFFLCTASFEEPEQNLAASLIVATETPGAGSASTAQPELEDVTIVGALRGEATTWTVNGGRQTADLSELTALLSQLAAIDRSLPVTIDAGAAVPMRDVVGAYDAARAAGFQRVLLAADAFPTAEKSP
ncbi:Biopolymer transport protein ExbD/TolR [Botrimarina colliarenosi]|uniref:Biopolymer transport protein ExbD/TolR n=1 Tax=Botrimarina colliarenosi TaxID=2528001 RepID=A0A5C6ABT2_9BACT|nr:biopolymer transporter ExbD [Botrimarina colliarenosi]TWT96837.1 Biopolymer transport protein ExbD/TolR [Botrimarina colliarenosi]